VNGRLVTGAPVLARLRPVAAARWPWLAVRASCAGAGVTVVMTTAAPGLPAQRPLRTPGRPEEAQCGRVNGAGVIAGGLVTGAPALDA
jgi:hypothetical protein